jgi:hypothetical protein
MILPSPQKAPASDPATASAFARIGDIAPGGAVVQFCVIGSSQRNVEGIGTTLMSTGRQIRSYDYVNHPYDRVRDVLKQNALEVFQAATKAAASRAESVAAELHVDFAGVGVKADIKIVVKEIQETPSDGIVTASTKLLLEWEAANLPRLFPLMQGELSVYPLTGTETQLDFSGTYEPPLGAVGKTMNAIAGHRIAEVSVHRFVSDVAGYLRRALAK